MIHNTFTQQLLNVKLSSRRFTDVIQGDSPHSLMNSVALLLLQARELKLGEHTYLISKARALTVYHSMLTPPTPAHPGPLRALNLS